MLTSLMSLWLSILLSGVALFFASFVAWMVLPHHKMEWRRLPNEEDVLAALRKMNIAPGQYIFPRASKPEEMKTEEFRRRLLAGPTGTITIWKRPPNMGLNMLCTVLFFVIANFVVAYLAAMVLPPISQADDRWRVFRFVGTAGVLTYGTANILNGIWFGRKMVADIVDGIVFGLITGAIFAVLWPGASV